MEKGVKMRKDRIAVHQEKIKCKYCGELTKKYQNRSYNHIRKFCSRKCVYSWAKENKIFYGENSGVWRGDNACITSKHLWINRHYGKPTKCENPFCNEKSSIYEWANIRNHHYTRKRGDYKMLCHSCHMKMDKSWLKKERNENGQFV